MAQERSSTMDTKGARQRRSDASGDTHLIDPDYLARLFHAAQANPDRDFAALYQTAWPQVYYTALGILSDEQDAHDAAQRTFIALFKNLNKVHNPQALLKWLNVTTLNQTRTLMREQNRDTSRYTSLDDLVSTSGASGTGKLASETLDRTLPTPAEPLNTAVENSERDRIVRTVLSTMPTKLKEVVYLYYWQELSTGEIARTLDISPGTVRMRLIRARAALLQSLKTYEQETDTHFFVATIPLAQILQRYAKETIPTPPPWKTPLLRPEPATRRSLANLFASGNGWWKALISLFAALALLGVVGTALYKGMITLPPFFGAQERVQDTKEASPPGLNAVYNGDANAAGAANEGGTTTGSDTASTDGGQGGDNQGFGTNGRRLVTLPTSNSASWTDALLPPARSGTTTPTTSVTPPADPPAATAAIIGLTLDWRSSSIDYYAIAQVSDPPPATPLSGGDQQGKPFNHGSEALATMTRVWRATVTGTTGIRNYSNWTIENESGPSIGATWNAGTASINYLRIPANYQGTISVKVAALDNPAFAAVFSIEVAPRPTAITGTPRTLTDAQTGDGGATWIEIARYGGYSLIVRDRTLPGNVNFGTDQNYDGSNVQASVNAWYRSHALTGLKGSASTHDALSKTGTSFPLLGDGFSLPSGTAPTDDTDVAFVLSSGEAIRYCSRYRYMQMSSGVVDMTGQQVHTTWLALSDRSSVHTWLRSPGEAAGVGSLLYSGGTVLSGDLRVDAGVRPALWVDSSIFGGP